MNTGERSCFARHGFVVLRGRAEPGLVGVLDDVCGRRGGDARPGRWSTNLSSTGEAPIFDALHACALWSELHDLVAPAELEHFDGIAQLVVNTPPNDLAPVEPHVDHHRRGAEVPDSFSLLVAVFLTHQSRSGEGNVWVWPGTHHLHAEYLAAYGPTALLAGAGKIKQVAPAVRLPRPVPVCGRRGDVLVAHPLLGHESGPNYGTTTRRAVYCRLRRSDHSQHWATCLTDPLSEYNIAED